MGRLVAAEATTAPRRHRHAAGLVGDGHHDPEVHDLAVPGHPRPRETAADLGFSGDSRSLLTSYETPEAPRTRGHRFVAWDVQDGTPTVLEEPGHYWLPEPGSAPTGVVWTRGHTVYREDPATGGRSSYALPWPAVTSSWAPDDTAFAYLGCPPGRSRSLWRLYAGRSLAEARDRALPLPVEPGQLLGGATTGTSSSGTTAPRCTSSTW